MSKLNHYHVAIPVVLRLDVRGAYEAERTISRLTELFSEGKPDPLMHANIRFGGMALMARTLGATIAGPVTLAEVPEENDDAE